MQILNYNTFTRYNYKKHPDFQGIKYQKVPEMLEFNSVEEWVKALTSEKKVSKFAMLLNKLGLKRNNQTEFIKNPGKLVISKDEHLILKDYIIELLDDLKHIAQNNRYIENKKNNIGKLQKNFLTKLYEYGCLTDQDLPKLFPKGAGIIDYSDFLYFAKRNKKLTPYDNNRILESRFNTHCKNIPYEDEILKQKLSQIKERELEEIKKIPQEGKLIVLHGAPGCGKSTLVKKLTSNHQKYYTKEADNIKTELYDSLPEDQGGIIAHKMAKKLLINEIQPVLLKEKRNFVYQATNDINIEQVIKKALKEDYNISYIHIYSPKDVNIPRTIERTHRIGRFTDPYDAYLIENLADNGTNILTKYPNISQYVYLSEFGHITKRL